MQEQKSIGIYVRVSTTSQDTGPQEQELLEYARLRHWHVYKVYRDQGVSGARESRPALDELLADCRRRKIDVVAVYKFDRFTRSLRQLLDTLELLKRLGIGFVSCTEAIDTSLPHGEMLFQIIGAIAQWERSLIGERVRAGLQHARSQGKRLGRPPLRTLSSKDIAALRRERSQMKMPFRKLATKYGISVWTAHALCGKCPGRSKLRRARELGA
jgi:DNA invertase Pin-like site-specific DNA recombinase